MDNLRSNLTKQPLYSFSTPIYFLVILPQSVAFQCPNLLSFAKMVYKPLNLSVSLGFMYFFVNSYAHKMEKAMAPHSSTLAWKIPWTEEPGRLQSMGSQRVGHD